MGKLIQRLIRLAGYELKPLSSPSALKTQNPDITEREWEIYSSIKNFTMLSLERVIANIRAVDYIVANNIPGDIVECGVWRGGSCMAMALALGDRHRTLWMYDTYTGMTEPTEVDRGTSGESAQALLRHARMHERPEESGIVALASLDDVRRNMQCSGYPMDKIRFVQGPVEQTIPKSIPEQIALLRIDTDWYESTRHELEHLYPRLLPGGVLVIDDYGHWQGARQAVDEYFRGNIFLGRIDYTGRIAIKPA